MKYIPILLGLLILSLSGCKSRKNDKSEAKEFFENSRRRKASLEEKSPILKFVIKDNLSCTAFLIQNTKNLNLVMTARHCAAYDVTSWCTAGGKFVSSDGLRSAACKFVIASDTELDFVLMEIDQPMGHRGYRLGNFDPPFNTRLKMIGYPSDPFAKSIVKKDPVVTDNCWVNSQETGTTNTPAKEKASPFRVFFHNCSTYGGNSGGPIIIEDSDVVIGMPASYKRNDFRSQKWTDYAELAPVVDFIKIQSEIFRSRGVVMLDSFNQEFKPATYRSVMNCSTSDKNLDIENLIPLYDSTQNMFGVEFKWKILEGKRQLTCSGDLCRDESGQTFTWTGIDTFTQIRRDNGASWNFKCTRI